MDKEHKPKKGTTVSSGVWSAQLYDHIKYFNEHTDIRELKLVLPFGIPRERKPKNWDKTQKKKKGANTLNRLQSSRLGMFHYQPKAEIKPWKPRLKPMKETTNQITCKHSLFVLRFDPSEKKVMYLEQDLMAKSLTQEIDKKTGFTYRLKDGRNIVVRKYLALINEKKLINLIKEFINECNRVLFLYCDTC